MNDSSYKNDNLKVYNILRKLGFRPNNAGTELILKAILSIQDVDFTNNISIVYKKIACESECTPHYVRISITYSITHRNELKSKENFESIFGYDYDEEVFSNKDLIYEIARII